MRQFNYKCTVAKNGSKMYYRKVAGKWKRISNTLGMKTEKGKRKYMLTDEELQKIPSLIKKTQLIPPEKAILEYFYKKYIQKLKEDTNFTMEKGFIKYKTHQIPKSYLIDNILTSFKKASIFWKPNNPNKSNNPKKFEPFDNDTKLNIDNEIVKKNIDEFKNKIIELDELGEKVGQDLVDILLNNNGTELFIGGNNIGDEGAKAIAKVLEKNTSLTRLDIRYNNIGDKGAEAIARSLEKIHHLQNYLLVVIILAIQVLKQSLVH